MPIKISNRVRSSLINTGYGYTIETDTEGNETLYVDTPEQKEASASPITKKN